MALRSSVRESRMSHVQPQSVSWGWELYRALTSSSPQWVCGLGTAQFPKLKVLISAIDDIVHVHFRLVMVEYRANKCTHGVGQHSSRFMHAIPRRRLFRCASRISFNLGLAGEPEHHLGWTWHASQ
jgi:hypothetical protein